MLHHSYSAVPKGREQDPCASFRLRGIPGRFGVVQTYIVLLTELLAQRGAHDDAALAGGSAEVRLARLPARRGDT